MRLPPPWYRTNTGYQYDKYPQQQQHDDDWRHPELLALSHEGPKVLQHQGLIIENDGVKTIDFRAAWFKTILDRVKRE